MGLALHLRGGRSPWSGRLIGTIAPENFDGRTLRFEQAVSCDGGTKPLHLRFAIPDPRLWWPNGLGEHNLYRLTLSFLPREGGTADTCSTTFAIRTVEMAPLPGGPHPDKYNWIFVINRRPVFVKGAGWCTMDPLMDFSRGRIDRLVTLARDQHVQMFRCWGSGMPETDEFYDACDRAGIMVLQAWPTAWNSHERQPYDVLEETVRLNTLRLRNHPSLVMWGGGNENAPPEGTDDGLFLIGRRCRQYDPSRPFHRTDPWGGSTHNWSVFHNGQPMDANYYSYSSVFYDEYGLPSMTNVSSCLKYLPPEELEKWPMDDSRHALIQHMHQFSSRDPIKVLRYCDYGPIRDRRTYIEYSQMAQGDWLRFAAEGQRSCSGQDKTGFWFYKFTDLFPGHSWAVVDYYGSPKISYYRAKQTCLSCCAFAVYPKLDWTDGEAFTAVIHVANDTATTFEGAEVRASVFGSDLTEVWTKDYDTPPLGPDERVELVSISLSIPAVKARPFLLAVTMREAGGRLVSDQWYWFNFKAKTERILELEKLDIWQLSKDRFRDAYEAYARIPAAPLLNLPRTELTAQVRVEGRKGTLTVRNIGAVPAFNVLIDDFPDGYDDYLDDNSFFLRPGQERVIPFELGAKSTLSGVTVRAWNAPVARLQP